MISSTYPSQNPSTGSSAGTATPGVTNNQPNQIVNIGGGSITSTFSTPSVFQPASVLSPSQGPLRQHTTGPVAAWYSFAGQSAPTLLGTCERWPAIEESSNWNPVFTDDAGSLCPYDKFQEGSTAMIVLDFNYFSATALNYLIGSDGTQLGGRGALLITNGLSFTLWLRYRFGGTPLADPNMELGQVFFACSVANVAKSPAGSIVRKVRLIVEANPIQVGTNFYTWSTNPTFFANIPAI